FAVYSANFMTADCCLKTSNREIPYNNVKCYKNQTTRWGCKIEATVFVTRRNKYLCAPPELEWVQNLRRDLDRKRPQYQKNCGK
ncbi:hypothetical protein GDO78_017571, partial [Eleutherodactylus coqui]